MVALNHPHDYVVLFLLAGGFGALGGLAHMFITPVERSVIYWGSALVGAVAAIAITYFFTPEVIVKAKDGTETRHWEIIKVIPLSLIVGAGGKTVITALQDRVLASVRDEKRKAGQRVAGAAMEHAVRNVADSATQAALEQVTQRLTDDVRAAPGVEPEAHAANLRATMDDVKTAVLGQLEGTIQAQVDGVKDTVAAATGETV